jgi:hypothetical protein
MLVYIYMATTVNIKPLLNTNLRQIELPKTVRKYWGFLPLALLVGLGAIISNSIKESQIIITQAGGGAILTMAPEKSVIRTGEIFTVDLIMDPKNSLVSDVYLAIEFPSMYLELLDAGKTHRQIHFDQVPTAVQIVTPIRFRALQPSGKVAIEYSALTKITSPNQDSQLNKAYGTSIEIK